MPISQAQGSSLGLENARWVKVPGTMNPQPKTDLKTPVVERKDPSKSPLSKEQKAVEDRAKTQISRAFASLRGRGRKRKGKARRNFGGKRILGELPELPPELNTSVTTHHVFRFYVGTAQSGSAITWANIAGITGVTGTVTNTTAVGFCSSWRIRSVTVWPPLASAGARSEIQWYTPATGLPTKDESKMESLPTGITTTAPVRYTPPPTSFLSEWLTAASVGSVSAVMMYLWLPAGAIMDVSISWTQNNNFGSASHTLATVAVGSYYYLGLDGATGQVVPVGLPTTI